MTSITNIHNALSYSWGKNCKSFLLNESDGLSVKLETMPPDTTEQLHYHNHATQVFFILTGNAAFIVDGNSFELQANDSLTILPGQKHLIKNESNRDLTFLVISQPDTQNDRINLAPG